MLDVRLEAHKGQNSSHRHVHGAHVERLEHGLLRELLVGSGFSEQDGIYSGATLSSSAITMAIVRLEAKRDKIRLDRHVHAVHADRLEHDLLEGTGEKTRQILQTSPNTFALVRGVFTLGVFAIHLGEGLASKIAVRSRLLVLPLLVGSRARS